MKSKEKRSADKESEGFTKKGILVSILVSLALTAVCIVFEVLCLKNFKIEFFVKYSTLLISLACAVTILYCLTAIFFCAKGKSTAYRVLLSGYLLIIFFLVLLFILQKTGFLEIFQNPDLYKEYLEKAGVWMPLLYIVLQYLQVVILPIPGVVSTLAGVALFGATKAMLCSLVGIILGSLTAFVIGRKVGYKAVAWMVGKEDLDKWLKKVKGKDNFILTAMFILPLFPDDMLCFVAGLSSMTWQYFLIMIVISRLIGIAATCYSIDFIPFNTWWGILIWIILIAVVIIAFVLLYKNLDAINSWFNKKFRWGNRKKQKTKEERQSSKETESEKKAGKEPDAPKKTDGGSS
ncbi:MAG: TVP38/TMEM64 family protein [Clostridia bacterium]|nr:TVP38/TMEM64 family protein [Clostridia bacterium]